MARDLRHPADVATFNALSLRSMQKTLRVPWWNLRWRAHAVKSDLFFSSLSGRLTPVSGTVPCLYLAENAETSFYEIYGDIISAARETKSVARFSKTDLEARVLIKTKPPLSVKIYDLTAVRSAKRIGMDLATLYAPDVDLPRQFAQRIHDHPEKFDGIQYESRHTQTRCLVLWATHTPALKSLATEMDSSLWERTKFPALPTGLLRLFDVDIQVAATP